MLVFLSSSSSSRCTLVLVLALLLLQPRHSTEQRNTLVESNLCLSVEADLLEGIDLHSEVVYLP